MATRPDANIPKELYWVTNHLWQQFFHEYLGDSGRQIDRLLQTASDEHSRVDKYDRKNVFEASLKKSLERIRSRQISERGLFLKDTFSEKMNKKMKEGGAKSPKFFTHVSDDQIEKYYDMFLKIHMITGKDFSITHTMIRLLVTSFVEHTWSVELVRLPASRVRRDVEHLDLNHLERFCKEIDARGHGRWSSARKKNDEKGRIYLSVKENEKLAHYMLPDEITISEVFQVIPPHMRLSPEVADFDCTKDAGEIGKAFLTLVTRCNERYARFHSIGFDPCSDGADAFSDGMLKTAKAVRDGAREIATEDGRGHPDINDYLVAFDAAKKRGHSGFRSFQAFEAHPLGLRVIRTQSKDPDPIDRREATQPDPERDWMEARDAEDAFRAMQKEFDSGYVTESEMVAATLLKDMGLLGNFIYQSDPTDLTRSSAVTDWPGYLISSAKIRGLLKREVPYRFIPNERYRVRFFTWSLRRCIQASWASEVNGDLRTKTEQAIYEKHRVFRKVPMEQRLVAAINDSELRELAWADQKYQFIVESKRMESVLYLYARDFLGVFEVQECRAYLEHAN